MTAIIPLLSSITAAAVPAWLLGIPDVASFLAIATIAAGAHIVTSEMLRTSPIRKD
jgi:hypothetical protein